MAEKRLENMSIEELKKLQKEAEKAIANFEARKRAEAVAELEEVARKHGYRLSELVGGKTSYKAVNPAKYKHPENASVTWTGRGRQPSWIKEGLASGKSLEDFAI